MKHSPINLRNSFFKNDQNELKFKNFISFDKIINYFELYLNKHQLIIAREMKSIKDLFKLQKKIQYQEDLEIININRKYN